MIERSTEAVVHWLIACGAVKEEDQELYCYAVYSFLLSISPLLLAAVFGLCLGCVKQSILTVIPFMILRKYSGGYHTKHLWTCFLCSSLLLLLCILFSLAAVCDRRLLAVTLLAGISLVICSPLDHENRVLSKEEKSCYKKMTILFTALFLFMGVMFYYMRLSDYAVCILTGIILSAGLQMPVILGRLIKKMR